MHLNYKNTHAPKSILGIITFFFFFPSFFVYCLDEEVLVWFFELKAKVTVNDDLNKEEKK